MVGQLVARLVTIYKWSHSAFAQGPGPTSATCTAVLVPSLILLHPSLRFLVRISQRFPTFSSILQHNILKLVIQSRRPLSLQKNAAVPPASDVRPRDHPPAVYLRLPCPQSAHALLPIYRYRSTRIGRTR